MLECSGGINQVWYLGYPSGWSLFFGNGFDVLYCGFDDRVNPDHFGKGDALRFEGVIDSLEKLWHVGKNALHGQRSGLLFNLCSVHKTGFKRRRNCRFACVSWALRFRLSEPGEGFFRFGLRCRCLKWKGRNYLVWKFRPRLTGKKPASQHPKRSRLKNPLTEFRAVILFGMGQRKGLAL